MWFFFKSKKILFYTIIAERGVGVEFESSPNEVSITCSMNLIHLRRFLSCVPTFMDYESSYEFVYLTYHVRTTKIHTLDHVLFAVRYHILSCKSSYHELQKFVYGVLQSTHPILKVSSETLPVSVCVSFVYRVGIRDWDFCYGVISFYLKAEE